MTRTTYWSDEFNIKHTVNVYGQFISVLRIFQCYIMRFGIYKLLFRNVRMVRLKFDSKLLKNSCYWREHTALLNYIIF